MNTHSWRRASPPTNSAGPMLLAGLTEVPSIGMPRRWTSVRARPITRPATKALLARLVTARITRNEHERENDFGHERAGCIRADDRMSPVAIRAKPDRAGVVTRRRVEDAEQSGQAPAIPSDNLCCPVAGSVGRVYAVPSASAKSDLHFTVVHPLYSRQLLVRSIETVSSRSGGVGALRCSFIATGHPTNLAPAEFENGDCRGGRNVEAPHTPELRDERDGVTSRKRAHREPMLFVADRNAHVVLAGAGREGQRGRRAPGRQRRSRPPGLRRRRQGRGRR